MSRRWAGWVKRTNKMGNKPTIVDNIRFHSMAEAEYYVEAKFLQRINEIYKLELQPKFEIWIGEHYIGHYRADFRYMTKDDVDTVIEVKGYETRLYKWQKKCFLALYPELTFIEVKA